MIRAHTDLHVASSPEDVFDGLADMRNELHWNREVTTELEKTTDGEVGDGTRFEGKMKRVGPMHMVITEYDRPWRLKTSGGGKPADVDFTATFEAADGGGTRVGATLEMQPKGVAKLFSPLMARQVQKQEEETMQRFKRWVESSRA